MKSFAMVAATVAALAGGASMSTATTPVEGMRTSVPKPKPLPLPNPQPYVFLEAKSMCPYIMAVCPRCVEGAFGATSGAAAPDASMLDVGGAPAQPRTETRPPKPPPPPPPPPPDIFVRPPNTFPGPSMPIGKRTLDIDSSESPTRQPNQ